MEKKQSYSAPSVKVHALALRSVLCNSPESAGTDPYRQNNAWGDLFDDELDS